MRTKLFLKTLLTMSVIAVLTAPAAWAQQDDRFADDDGNVHEGFIEAVAAEGITEGCDANRYCPDAVVTRGQMASFLQRALDLADSDENAFADDDGHTHEDAINAVAAAGIATGCAEDRFCPGDAVHRDQMATFLVTGFTFIESSVNFFRDDNGNTHENNINALARAAVTSSCNDTYLDYCPRDVVRRDQMATFLARAIGLQSHAEPDREVAYQVGTRGDVQGDPDTFRMIVAETLKNPRGWALDGLVRFLAVDESDELRIWLASPEEVEQAAPVCSAQYSCRVGNDVYINDERWRQSTDTYSDRELRAYRHYVLNHEVGHWIELDHRDCPYNGASAPVMQQQSISLDGCESRVWPLPEERDQARENLGVG